MTTVLQNFVMQWEHQGGSALLELIDEMSNSWAGCVWLCICDGVWNEDYRIIWTLH